MKLLRPPDPHVVQHKHHCSHIRAKRRLQRHADAVRGQLCVRHTRVRPTSVALAAHPPLQTSYFKH